MVPRYLDDAFETILIALRSFQCNRSAACRRGDKCYLESFVPDLSAHVRAGVRKPPRKEPAGIDRAVCRLWGFNGAVACVRDTLAGVVVGGPTIAVGSLSLQIVLTQGRIDLHLRQLSQDETAEIDVPRGGVWLLQPGVYDIDSGGPDQPTRITVFGGSARFAGGGVDTLVSAGNVLVLPCPTHASAASCLPASKASAGRWRRASPGSRTRKRGRLKPRRMPRRFAAVYECQRYQSRIDCGTGPGSGRCSCFASQASSGVPM